MQTREETARAFADAMGWMILPWADPPTTLGMRGWVEFETRLPKLVQDNVRLPAADAPLHEHLAFVGRASSARRDHPPYKLHIAYEHGLGAVVWINDVRGDAPDLSWAAMLAAITAAESKS